MRSIVIGTQLVGHIVLGGCANPACRKHIREGRVWHATPAGFAATLEPNHFRTSREAVSALAAEAKAHPEKLRESERLSHQGDG